MRIHWSVRYSAFIASVFTLSLFFAGWREFMEQGQISGIVLLAAGVLLTLLLLFVQGYWIYFEEKDKGTLRRHVGWFESIHSFLEARYDSNRFVRMIQPVKATVEKGNSEQ
jgi:hypothetical protein